MILQANPAEIEERADGIDHWARARIRRGSRAATTAIWTPAEAAAVELLNKSQRDYVLRVSSMNGGLDYRVGDDVVIAVVDGRIVRGALRLWPPERGEEGEMK